MTRLNGALLTAGALSIMGCTPGSSANSPDHVRFSISFPASARAEPVTGRMYLMISPDSTPEPRLRGDDFVASTPLFGVDVTALAPGQTAVINDATASYPVTSLSGIPAGDYFVQAVLSVYTQFHRADGHVIWAHMDQWEGQHFGTSPGNLTSLPQRVHIDPGAGYDIPISLNTVIPPIALRPDSKWIKHIKIRSDMLTKFWGQPVFLGATVLLPAGYDSHPNAHYPVIYQQGHFGLSMPFDFDTTTRPIPEPYAAILSEYNLQPGAALYKSWSGPNFPRVIAINFQHPTPYFDDSYAVNSVNNGPYGDAIMHELIPYLEAHFRAIPQSYARVLTGGSTGGWESLALQIYHPEFFGGTWTLYPDPVDLRHNSLIDIYTDTNAFSVSPVGQPAFSPIGKFFRGERYFMRGNDGQPFITVRDFSRFEDVLGSHGRSAEQLEAWDAVYGPIGPDGYPVPLWDKRTGHIDHEVANYIRDHGFDLTEYLRRNWSTVGPKLVDKIHIDVGDMDNFYLNLAVYDLQQFLDSTKAPHVPGTFRYGRPMKGHGWQAENNSDFVREMAAAMARRAPPGAPTQEWHY
jgi:hypothetical protein